MKAGASKHVLTLVAHGKSSHDIHFGIGELVVGDLTTRIKTGEGIEDDEEFWRLASQLVSGVADIHQLGILHLAVQVCVALSYRHVSLFLRRRPRPFSSPTA